MMVIFPSSIMGVIMRIFRVHRELFWKFGGPEKGRFVKWCTEVLLKHVLRGYGEPAGCPWA